MKIYPPAKNVRLTKYPQGNIYQSFGENKPLYNNVCVGTECLTGGHNGIDIVLPENTPILGTYGKVVERKDDVGGYGKHVRILTPRNEQGYAFELIYGHLNKIDVPLGLVINDAMQIGLCGNTGFVISGSTPYWGDAPAGRGVHLHLGLRVVKLFDPSDLKWNISYATGDKGTIQNYNNGTFGWIDPMSYFDYSRGLVETPYLNDVIDYFLVLLNKWKK